TLVRGTAGARRPAVSTKGAAEPASQAATEPAPEAAQQLLAKLRDRPGALRRDDALRLPDRRELHRELQCAALEPAEPGLRSTRDLELDAHGDAADLVVGLAHVDVEARVLHDLLGDIDVVGRQARAAGEAAGRPAEAVPVREHLPDVESRRDVRGRDAGDLAFSLLRGVADPVERVEAESTERAPAGAPGGPAPVEACDGRARDLIVRALEVDERAVARREDRGGEGLAAPGDAHVPGEARDLGRAVARVRACQPDAHRLRQLGDPVELAGDVDRDVRGADRGGKPAAEDVLRGLRAAAPATRDRQGDRGDSREREEAHRRTAAVHRAED